jgi:hypothetical protein
LNGLCEITELNEHASCHSNPQRAYPPRYPSTNTATGLLLIGAAGMLTGFLACPKRHAGLFLLPYAGFVAFIGTRPAVAKGALWTIISLNTFRVIESIILLIGGWVSPTALGAVFVIAQAVVVAVFAELQVIGLRKTMANPLVNS